MEEQVVEFYEEFQEGHAQVAGFLRSRPALHPVFRDDPESTPRTRLPALTLLLACPLYTSAPARDAVRQYRVVVPVRDTEVLSCSPEAPWRSR